jgi:hypothetical protein
VRHATKELRKRVSQDVAYLQEGIVECGFERVNECGSGTRLISPSALPPSDGKRAGIAVTRLSLLSGGVLPTAGMQVVAAQGLFWA